MDYHIDESNNEESDMERKMFYKNQWDTMLNTAETSSYFKKI